MSFEEVAIPWLDDVFRYSRYLAKDPTDAEDLVQETFLRALRGWHTFAAGTDCRRWLFTICRNSFIQRVQSKRPVAYDTPELEALAAAAVADGVVSSGMGHVFGQVDLADAIQEALLELSEDFREAVVLVDLKGMSYQDAAQILDVPVGTVRSRLFRGRRLLQERLLAHAEDAGLVPPRPPAARPEVS
ncbi:MAG: sigma-70 family RNA polymerase sigma factor [Gemmatimonadetes bacterium]|nr:sigma-70 family RNA polymerase sigma factor [Gemmatimonadota bacterium]